MKQTLPPHPSNADDNGAADDDADGDAADNNADNNADVNADNNDTMQMTDDNADVTRHRQRLTMQTMMLPPRQWAMTQTMTTETQTLTP